MTFSWKIHLKVLWEKNLFCMESKITTAKSAKWPLFQEQNRLCSKRKITSAPTIMDLHEWLQAIERMRILGRETFRLAAISHISTLETIIYIQCSISRANTLYFRKGFLWWKEELNMSWTQALTIFILQNKSVFPSKISWLIDWKYQTKINLCFPLKSFDQSIENNQTKC